MGASVNNVQAAPIAFLPDVWEYILIPISLADAVVSANSNTTRNTLVMLRAGVITGLRVDLDGTVTDASGMTWKVSKNGAATALTLTCNSGGNATGGSATSAGIAFAAGDTIGMLITTAAGLLPASTLNGSAWIEVRYA